ncbi:Oidioi.mRNA.OKI2018_I69.XSR.g13480.t1.cds [Oikopleura dioica]|uniref:Oidioi.mRNA.OKI2018_I69.XSR.g13480.t1.cds n=1 Tax=Oikopleura dioica TaxID=34765 RepID=A0ABN7SAQ9_OIKDI|nr:Oidioi.mRNA.OKI2018_I69.XSR.g13480.t1.cds [Oikopleura dioica]
MIILNRARPQEDDDARLREIRSKVSELGHSSNSKSLLQKNNRRKKKAKRNMQVFYVSELSSESEASDNESDVRRLEKAAKVAMEDAHRRACIESATLRSSSSANTPTSYAPSTLNQMNLAELGNHHLLLERRIAELNDELARPIPNSGGATADVNRRPQC